MNQCHIINLASRLATVLIALFASLSSAHAATSIPGYQATVGLYFTGSGSPHGAARSEYFLRYDQAKDWLDEEAQKSQFAYSYATEPKLPLTDGPLKFLHRVGTPPSYVDYFVHDYKVTGDTCVGGKACGCFDSRSRGSVLDPDGNRGNVVYGPRSEVLDAFSHLYKGGFGFCPAPEPGETDPWYMTLFYSSAMIQPYNFYFDAKNLGPCEDCAGNPISIATGNKYQTESDYASTGLSFTRYYNSLAYVRGPLGSRWLHEYDASLIIDSTQPNTVRALRGTGKLFAFTASAGNWTAEVDVADRLVFRSDLNLWEYTTAGDQVERYSATGKLISITERSGMVKTLTYSDANTPPSIAPAPGLLIEVADSFGRKLGFTYTAKKRLATMTDPGGGVTSYVYTGEILTTVTHPDLTYRQYLYNEAAHTGGANLPYALTGILDENGHRHGTYKYSSTGVALSTSNGDDVNKYSVNVYSNSSTVIDPLNTTSTYSYVQVSGSAKRAGRAITGLGTEYSPRDANGNVASRTDFKGNKTCYAYDLTRNLETARVEGLGSSANCTTELAASSHTVPARKITTTWHATYRLPLAVTEPTIAGSKVTTFGYDASGNLLSKSVAVAGATRTWSWTYDSFGRVLTATDPRNTTTTNAYYDNTSGQGAKRGMLYTVTNAANQTTTITDYNAFGQPLSLTDANGLVTSIAYDARQRINTRTVGSETTTFDYDYVGQLKKVTLPDSSNLQYAYDGAHRLVEIKDGFNNRVVYTLDNAGNRIQEQYADPDNLLTRSRTRVYDALNRLQKDIGGTNPGEQISLYGYDLNGNLASTTDAQQRITTQTYDALNRLVNVVDPFNGAGAPVKYEYDVQDNLTKVTDPKNLATTYSYNGFNNVTSQVSPDTGTTGFTYDAAGNLATRTDARGVVATYSYDNLNRVATISYPAFGADPAETVTYAYDTCANGKGRLCSLTDKTGTTVWTYDQHGRITGKSQTVGTATQSVAYGYNSAGQLASITTPSGKVITYGYSNNRPVSVQIGGKTVLSQALYEPLGPIGGWLWGNSTPQAVNEHQRFHDLDYRATQVMSDVVGVGHMTRNLTWNSVDTITAITDPLNAINSFAYGYDSLDRLTSVSGGAAYGFSYDGTGNRLTQSTTLGTTSYTYPGTSHKLSALTGVNAKSIAYDAAGNRTVDGATTWTYGANNRPVAVTAGGSTSLFLINALGQRVKKTVGSAVTRFFYDEAGRLLGEYDDTGARIREHVWLNDLPVAVIP